MLIPVARLGCMLSKEMCWSVLRREFRLVNFRLLYPNSEDFVQSPVSKIF